MSLTTECDLDSVTCIFVIDQMHICHWPPYKEMQKNLGVGIFVIDQMHKYHWPLSVILTQ